MLCKYIKLLIISLLWVQPMFVLAQEDVCKQVHAKIDEEAEIALKERVERYRVQDLYLGMGLREFFLIHPTAETRKKFQDEVVLEIVGELEKGRERFNYAFTMEGQLYRLLYKKNFRFAVSSEDLLKLLVKQYGQPAVVIEQFPTHKSFEACWGQCDMIQQGVFCYSEKIDTTYTYFTASLNTTGKQLSIVLNDARLLRRNQELFEIRKRKSQQQASDYTLKNLNL